MYVGQTKNIKKRWSEHSRPSRNRTVIEKAFNKYGKENFLLEVLEELDSQENANEREKYWISYYNTFKNAKHYNMHVGGNNQDSENNPMYGLKGEKCPTSKTNKDIALKIYNEYNNNKSNTIYNLSKKYKLSTTTVSEICSGKHFTTLGLENIIRKNIGINRNNCLSIKECLKIYEMYKCETQCIDYLSKLFNVSTAVIREVCQGTHWSAKGKLNLMKHKHTSSKITKEAGIEILNFYLKNNNLKQTYEYYKNIYDVSYRTVQRICAKQHWSVLEKEEI